MRLLIISYYSNNNIDYKMQEYKLKVIFASSSTKNVVLVCFLLDSRETKRAFEGGRLKVSMLYCVSKRKHR